MIIRARVVVTMDGPPIENGAVVVAGDRILDVGKFSEISKQHSTEEIVDLGEQALLPGLINAHCHLDYTCLRGKIPRQKSFPDWIRAINTEKAKLSAEDYVASINQGFADAKRFGTTTIANLTAFPELIPHIQASIRTWWFAELIDVRDPSRANEIADAALENLKTAEHRGLAPHAPFTASANLYRRCEEIARREDILLTTHLAESREEISMFRDASGPLYDFLKEIGRDMSDCGDETPLRRFSEILRDSSTSVGMTDDWMLVHLNEISGSDLRGLNKQLIKSHVIHCPRSHEYFGHSPFQFHKLRELGFNICLGTDSLASNDDLSLFAEVRAFQKKFPAISPEEILKMVTVNSARALRQENALGKVQSGFVADLIGIPIAESRSVFEQIVGFDRPVNWSMISGEVENSA
ncbi:MAG TPA: amidohydrolase family protein [Chthoniobacterales bacterium]|nr:amidohydrolase family protein [Chthoniobacterales bacterium]